MKTCMPWQKGQSGNPGGKPRGAVRLSLRETRERAAKSTEKAIRVFERCCARIDRKGATDKDWDRARAAANDLLVWANGKPAPWADDATGLPADFASKAPEEQRRYLEERMALYAQALAVLAAKPVGERDVKPGDMVQ